MPQPTKPTAVLLAEKGKLYDKQRARAESEPVAKRDLRPRQPPGLSRQQVAAWKYVCGIADNYGLLTAANAVHLEMLARNFAAYREAAKAVDRDGYTITTDTGAEKINPALTVMQRFEKNVRADLAAIGLGSVGLARIGSLIVRAQETAAGMEALID